MPTFDKLRAKFGRFYDLVRSTHQEGAEVNRGHDLLHDVTVGQYAVLLAPDVRTAEKAWIAALCHSQDYLVGRNKKRFRERVRYLLAQLPKDITKLERREIEDAAIRHGEKNRDDQSLTQQVLMDADRLAILMMGVTFRIGQGSPHIPVVQLEHLEAVNPESSYANPKSCLDDLRWCINEFLPQFRIPKARDLAEKKIAQLKQFIEHVCAEYRGLGLTDVAL
jgi:hypothetical protein